jgi:hypothetical protein
MPSPLILSILNTLQPLLRNQPLLLRCTLGFLKKQSRATGLATERICLRCCGEATCSAWRSSREGRVATSRANKRRRPRSHGTD